MARLYALLLLISFPLFLQAQPHYFNEVNLVRNFLALPDEKIDLGAVKLMFDHFIDPTIDYREENKKLDLMVDQINLMVKEVAQKHEVPITDSLKMRALRTFLYDDNKPIKSETFQYNSKDPLGQNIFNKLLPNYLESRKGNCVTMPILYVILGQRLGLDVSLTLAPLHFLVTFTDENGQSMFIETTSGGYEARESYLREALNISDLAIENNIYLKKLSKKETVAAMATTMMEFAIQQKQYGKSMYIADAILDAHPSNVYAMVKKASAAGFIIEPYRRITDVPQNQLGQYYMFVSINSSLFEKAESLGWKEQSIKEQKFYLERLFSIDKERESKI